ncbi:hypothetical protein NDU88_007648 [Pleurodeles waltl]|uniref:Uncharacterized protein n=1 Tax=Pleurodeles waltl TaxID=8319 RepID=A0AAV7N2P0_PLEWA|nr:hypothetical protein NDU88_007648 [Pleurodeles waltl]
MAWAYFCWRDGGGFVTSTFPPTAGLAVCCGGRIFGGLPSAGQNDRGGFPRPRRDYGGFLTGGRRLLPPRSALKGDAYIMASEGEPTPPEGSPACMVVEEKGVAPCLWMKQWHKLTEKEGCLAFLEHRTFNTRVLENLGWMLSVQKPPPRPAQYEALAVWDLMAIKQRQQKFERRIKRAEKTLAEARWDNDGKMWRRGKVDGLKLFPAIAQGDETQGKKATCKTDKDSSKPKETKRSRIEEDDSDDEEFLNQILHDRPPPYAVSDNVPSTSAGPGNQTQEKGVTDTVQTSDTGLIQNGVSVPTAPDMPIQLQLPPQIQRIYPDVPVLETTTNLIVPPDPIYTKSRLVQLEPTPQLLPQPQQQLIPGYNPAAGPPLVPARALENQTFEVAAPWSLGPVRHLLPYRYQLLWVHWCHCMRKVSLACVIRE